MLKIKLIMASKIRMRKINQINKKKQQQHGIQFHLITRDVISYKSFKI